jgi:hypothetical protein
LDKESDTCYFHRLPIGDNQDPVPKGKKVSISLMEATYVVEKWMLRANILTLLMPFTFWQMPSCAPDTAWYCPVGDRLAASTPKLDQFVSLPQHS